MQIFLVGGAIRDRLLSLPVQEHDWVVVGSTPEEMINQGYRQVGKDFPVFLHPKTNEEYALARTERKSGQGHQGFTVFSSPEITLEQDLIRRDLTVNAIAEDEDGNFIDPYQGQKDLQNRILRHISPAFAEDPLRVLRVARFASRFWDLGFTIAPETLELMSTISNSGELELLSKERIWRETKLAFRNISPRNIYSILLQIGALKRLLPEIVTILQNKESLLKLPHLRDIETVEFKYVGLIMIASEEKDSFNMETVKKINASLLSPTTFQELATLCAHHFENCSTALSLPANIIYSLLLKLDAFRRQNRCLRVIDCIKTMRILLNKGHSPSLDFLTEVIPQLNTISIQEERLKDLDGKEIGMEFDKLRQEAITNELKKFK